MKIQNSAAGSANQSIKGGGQQREDSQLNAIQNQINGVQKKLQSLNKDEAMSAEEKASKRKEYQQEIQALNKELSQRKIDIQREQREAAAAQSQNKSEGNQNGAPLSEADGKNGSQQGNSMGLSTMKSIISAEATMKAVDTVQSVKTGIEGTNRILNAEIKLDKNRGQDTSQKEALVRENGQRIEGLMEDLGKKIGKASAEAEKIQETEKTEKPDETEKAEALKEKEQKEAGTGKTPVNLEKGQYVDERI